MKRTFILLCLCAGIFVSCKKATQDIKPAVSPVVNATTPAVQKLSAKFTYTAPDPINIFENQQVQFTNLSTGATSCIWEFGNTTKSRENEPSISYPWHGYYTVKLTVFDDKGNKESYTQDISILCLFYNGVHPNGNNTGTGSSGG